MCRNRRMSASVTVPVWRRHSSQRSGAVRRWTSMSAAASRSVAPSVTSAAGGASDGSGQRTRTRVKSAMPMAATTMLAEARRSPVRRQVSTPAAPRPRATTPPPSNRAYGCGPSVMIGMSVRPISRPKRAEAVIGLSGQRSERGGPACALRGERSESAGRRGRRAPGVRGEGCEGPRFRRAVRFPGPGHRRRIRAP